MNKPDKNTSAASAAKRPRRTVESFEDPLQHLWAISYADLLMVLLSFFIVLMQPKDKKEEVPIKAPEPGKVAVVLDEVIPKLSKMFFGADLGVNKDEVYKKAQDASAKLLADAKAKEAQAKLNITTLPEKIISGPINPIYQVLATDVFSKDLSISSGHDNNEILIHFDKDAYGSGKYAVSKEMGKKLEKVLNLLQPYKENLIISFIGHADSLPVSPEMKEKGVMSNMLLSSMRSAVAADVAIAKGFPPQYIRTEGTGSYGRNSRTLTIRITERSN